MNDHVVQADGWTVHHSNEQKLAEWAHLGRTNTYFMATIIGFKDLSNDLHLRMATWIQRDSLRKLGLCPRDHLKSSLWTVADTLRIVTADPLERVLIINEVASNAYNFLYRIRTAAEKCELWRLLYPERIPDTNGRWRTEALEFPRSESFPEASIEAIGVGGASTSRHFTRIKEDDLVGAEAANSPATMESAISQHKLADYLIVDPKTSRIDTYGTRWEDHDLYAWMLKNELGLDKFITGCYGVDATGRPNTSGKPIWPERWDENALNDSRVKNGLRIFSLQMLNLPLGVGIHELQLEWLKRYELMSDGKREYVVLHEPHRTHGYRKYYIDELAVFEAIDPNFSPDSPNSRTAVVTIGLTPHVPFDIIILGVRAKASTPLGAIDMGHEEWVRWKPIVAGIEVVAGQMVFFYTIPTYYPDMGIRPLKTNPRKSKFSRIREISPFAEQGRVWIRDGMNDLLDEWEMFPPGPSGTVDILDALAYAIKMSAPPDITNSETQYDDWDDEPEDLSIASGRNRITGY